VKPEAAYFMIRDSQKHAVERVAGVLFSGVLKLNDSTNKGKINSF